MTTTSVELKKELSVFETLVQVDVNGHVKKKNGLSYLAWTYAWSETKKLYPDATYKIWKDDQERPYLFDSKLGYMCFTTVTINDETLEMWLPVMDGANKAQKDESYTYDVKDVEWINGRSVQKKNADGSLKFITKKVEAATMFDINTTIMRCLVKNLAMFGLGHYIYAGESIPESLVDITGLIKIAIDDISEHENEKDLLKIWADSKLVQKEPDFLKAFVTAATKYLKGCKAEKDLKVQWVLFKDSLGLNEDYLASFKKEQGRIMKPSK